MMKMNGYIRLHRKLVEWGWYSDCVVKDVFLHILMTASYTDGWYMGIKLEPGQAIIKQGKLANELGFSRQQIRTALDKLQSTHEITLDATNKFTVATVENWAMYQCNDSESNHQITNEQPSNNHQITNEQPTYIYINKESKKVRKEKGNKVIKKESDKEKKSRYGEYDNVLLTDAEHEKLLNEFPLDYAERIDRLSEYMASTGRTYKNHLATIRAWARKDGDKKQSERKGRLDWIDEV